ncbi:MAG TPA: hypothetical protein VGB13_13760, partial [Candidatus Krumholzibacteria bacterium]
MLGVFVLARELSRSHAGGLVALGLAAFYPSFSLQIGRLFPEWIFAGVFVWSAYCYAVAVRRSSYPWMAAAGLLLGGGFFLRAQLMNYFPILLGLGLALSAPLWLRASRTRRLALVLVVACLPSIAAWRLVAHSARGDFSKIQEFGFYMFPEQQLYPYGFWMLMEADGWMGAYQLRDDAFYYAMREAAKEDTELLRSRPRQFAFTARYVTARLGESILLVLDNIYRTYDRPANNFQWDYPFSTAVQSWYQKAVVVLALAGMAAFAVESAPLAGVFFVPLCLALLFGLGTPQPRYGQPSMLIVLAVAGALVATLARRWPEARNAASRHRRAVIAAAVAGLVLYVAGSALRVPLPASARVVRGVATLSLLVVPFLATWMAFGRSRRQAVGLAASWSALALLVSAHLMRDRNWHALEMRLGPKDPGVQQEIHLSAEALSKLRTASQAFVLFDVHAPSGDLSGTEVEINGVRFDGTQLLPAMPRLGESTSAGGRNPKQYRQWWALPIERSSEVLPKTAPGVLSVSFTVSDGG